MKPELEKTLVDKYSVFFDYLKPHEGPIIPIQFGIDTDNGWYWLLDNLMSDIKDYTKSNQKGKRVKNKYLRKIVDIKFYRYHKNISKPLMKLRRYILDNFEMETYDKFSNVNITQIKEKFGGLRFYYDGGDEMIHGMVWFAESLSYDICEVCGSHENVYQTKGGWVQTICEKCKPKS